MNIAITGHSRGIGKALYDVLTKNSFEVAGYSRTNGFDISLESQREEILNCSLACDVFINNAYHKVGQLDLLKKFTELWRGDPKKLIININSKIIHANYYIPEMEEYRISKIQQQRFIESKLLNSNPQILNVILGLVDTEMSQIFNGKKLKPNDVAEMLKNLIITRNIIYTQEIIIDVPEQNWEDIHVGLT